MSIDPLALHQVSRILVLEYVTHVIRYAVLAGGAYLAFYVWFRRRALGRKIQEAFPTGSDIRREVLYSLLSFGVFCASGLLTIILSRLGCTQLYFKIARHGWPYLWFSLFALIFIHDSWFYWTHRLMHWRPLFPLVHRIHHLSHNPTPWASFSFHPLEAIIQAIIFPLTVLFLPLHPLAAFLWLLYMTGMNVFGHLGFEILPAGFLKSRLFRWHNTSVHHNMHHRYVHCNYGLYFNIWDRLMRTNHPRYEEEYDRIFSASADQGPRSSPEQAPAAART